MAGTPMSPYAAPPPAASPLMPAPAPAVVPVSTVVDSGNTMLIKMLGDEVLRLRQALEVGALHAWLMAAMPYLRTLISYLCSEHIASMIKSFMVVFWFIVHPLNVLISESIPHANKL